MHSCRCHAPHMRAFPLSSCAARADLPHCCHAPRMRGIQYRLRELCLLDRPPARTMTEKHRGGDAFMSLSCPAHAGFPTVVMRRACGLTPLLSCAARAGHPVSIERIVFTGSSACADDDGKAPRRRCIHVVVMPRTCGLSHCRHAPRVRTYPTVVMRRACGASSID